MRWSADRLLPAQVAAVANWPSALAIETAHLGRILFCHATPRSDNELFTRLTPEESLAPIFEATGADLIVCGHTHMQFDRTIGVVRVVNAGSVGMPFGDPGAYWLRLDGGVELRRTDYDLVAATERIQASDYPLGQDFDVKHPASEEGMLELFQAAALQ